MKEIVSLRKALHDLAGSQPKCDPFSRKGSHVWQEWTEGCRDAETALRDAGEEI